MLFWLLASALTVIASLAVLLPLARNPREPLADDNNDLRVYRDQLGELERDLARGAIRPDDAAQARAEIGRRMMRAAESHSKIFAPANQRGFRLIALASVLTVPIASWGLYAFVGSPDLPSQPLQARLDKPPSENTPEELVARAENHLAKNPEDGRGWDVLAPTYVRLGRPSDAVVAYRNALRLEGDSADRFAGLGEALAMTNGGIISAEAEAAFNRALSLQPGMAKAEFFLALGLAQDGKQGEAVAQWQSLLDKPDTDAGWRRAAEYALAQSSGTAAQGQGGPSQADVDGAAKMSGEDRAAMIETMVAGLDEKLRANPNDPEGWIRLVRSYVVLGKPGDAKSALRRALDALGGESEEGRKVAASAAEQGVSVTE